MRYATKDENGKVIIREISDRKKCLTYAEWKSLLEETTMKDHLWQSGSDYKYDSDGKRTAYFWVKFNYYAGFPLMVAEIHSRFGRGVEVNTLDVGFPNYELDIRAYSDWR
jgi:hypothetical protein